MSHEIETAVFMAAQGAGWTGLGRAIPESIASDPRAIAELCDATWTVETRPVYYKDAAGFTVAEGAAAQVRSDTGRVLSITSDTRYHVKNRQPVDVFEAFRDDLAKASLAISHAAVLRGGATIAVSAIMPSDNDITVGKGDRLQRYITLSTGYDRKHGTKATDGTIRVVCANTLAASLSQAERDGKLQSIRASTELAFDSLVNLLRDVRNRQDTETYVFNKLANTSMSDADVARYFADVLEVDISKLAAKDANGKDVISTRTKNMLAALVSAYRTGPGAVTASGTAWGALHAVTYYATHEKACRDTSDDGPALTRIASNMTGDSAKLKARALQLAAQFAKVAA